MKKIIVVLLSAVILASSVITVGAAKMYNDEYCRFNDFTDLLSEEKGDDINDRAWAVLKNLDFDCVIVTCGLKTKTIEEYTSGFYANNEFGWGENKDGIIFCLDVNNDNILLQVYGRGNDIFTSEALSEMNAHYQAEYAETDAYQLLCNYIAEVEEVIMASEKADETTQEASETVSENTPGEDTTEKAKPDWFPEHPEQVTTRFHGENLERVVDDADIFTDAEEAQISSEIEKIEEEYGIDYVVYTDTSSYGYDRGTWAANFYEFNGYGEGDNYSGLVLFICMQKGNRGWWTAGTGDIEGLFTEYAINRIDDTIEPYFISAANGEGSYADAVLTHTGQISSLLSSQNKPDWYPANPEEFVPFHGENLEYIVDECGLFKDSQMSDYLAGVTDLSEKYGVGVVILVTDNTYWEEPLTYAEHYVSYKGYGQGDDYMAFIFLAQKQPGGKYKVFFSGTPTAKDKYLDKSETIMEEHIDAVDTISESVEVFLKDCDYLLKRGHLAQPVYVHVMVLILILVLFAVVRVIVSTIIYRRTSGAKVSVSAVDYIVPGSLSVSSSDRVKLGTSVVRHYNPPSSSSSSSSSSSGRSSYSGGYHSSSSSGSSYSGGGRSF